VNESAVDPDEVAAPAGDSLQRPLQSRGLCDLVGRRT